MTINLCKTSAHYFEFASFKPELIETPGLELSHVNLVELRPEGDDASSPAKQDKINFRLGEQWRTQEVMYRPVSGFTVEEMLHVSTESVLKQLCRM